MPNFIFWPSSLVGPLSAAEIPNRISVSVTPRKRVLLPASCWSGCGADATCACAFAGGGEGGAAAGPGEACAGCATGAGAGCARGAGGAGCGTRAGAGRATEAVASGAFVASRSARPFDGAASAAGRSDGFEGCDVSNRPPTTCNTGLKKIIPSARTPANMNNDENRANTDDALRSDRCGGGSGIRSGQESTSSIVRRS